jgi:IS5 family transposase
LADVFGGSAYRSSEIEERLRAGGFKSLIHVWATRKHSLSDAQANANHNRSKIHLRAEHVFAAQQTPWATRSYARSASCEYAPKLAYRTWPTTFAGL